jgi:hypothetical protein
MDKLLLSLLLLLLTVGSAPVEQIIIRHVSELIKPAEVIARVTVLSVQKTGATEGYSKIAQVRVTDPIKGLEAGSFFELENDVANVECPHVSYAAGEDVLLFAKSMPNGHYETVYADAGKFLIESESVSKQPFRKGQSYISARTQIKREMKRIGRVQD